MTTVYRLSIEVLQADDHDAAVAAVKALRADVSDTPGVFRYTDEVAPWGKEIEGDTFVIDFDRDNIDEAEVDTICAAKIAAFLASRTA